MNEEKQVVDGILDMVMNMLQRGETPLRLLQDLIKDYYFRATVEAVEGSKIIVGGGREATILNNGRFSPGDEVLILNTGERLFAYYPVRAGYITDSEITKAIETIDVLKIFCLGFSLDSELLPTTLTFIDRLGIERTAPVEWAVQTQISDGNDVRDLTTRGYSVVVRKPEISDFILLKYEAGAVDYVNFQAVGDDLNYWRGTNLKAINGYSYYRYLTGGVYGGAWAPAAAVIETMKEWLLLRAGTSLVSWDPDNPLEAPVERTDLYASLIQESIITLNNEVAEFATLLQAYADTIPSRADALDSKIEQIVTLHPGPWHYFDNSTRPATRVDLDPAALLRSAAAVPNYPALAGVPFYGARLLDANNNLVIVADEMGQVYAVSAQPMGYVVCQTGPASYAYYWITDGNEKDLLGFDFTSTFFTEEAAAGFDASRYTIPTYPVWVEEGIPKFDRFDEANIEASLLPATESWAAPPTQLPETPLITLILPPTITEEDSAEDIIKKNKMNELYRSLLDEKLRDLVSPSVYQTHYLDTDPTVDTSGFITFLYDALRNLV